MIGYGLRCVGAHSGIVFALVAILCGVLGSVALKLLSVTPPAQAIVKR